MKVNAIIIAFLTAAAYSAPVDVERREQDSVQAMDKTDVLAPRKFGEKYNGRIWQPKYRNFRDGSKKIGGEGYGYLAERDTDEVDNVDFTDEADGLDMEAEDAPEEDANLVARDPKYISYGALQRNTVPCSQRGASYSNCKPGAEANPYSRGCSAITKCRGKMVKRWLMDQGLGFVAYL